MRISLASVLGISFLVLVASDDGSSKSAVLSSSHSARQLQECPDYRYLDTVYPNTPIFGAPNGCRCWEGLSELHCSYCEDDAPCQQHDSSHACRKGFRYAEEDERLAYKCNLFGEFENLYPNGKASFYFDVKAGTANVSVFKTRNIDSFHLMDCSMSGCTYDLRGGSGASCELASCSCTDQCDDWFVTIVDELSDNPAEIIVDNPEDPSSVVTILVGAQTIETNCTASACTADTNPDWGAYKAPLETDSTSSETAEDSSSAQTVSLGWMMLILVVGWLSPSLS